MEIAFRKGNELITFSADILDGVQESAHGVIIFHGAHSPDVADSAALKLDELIKEDEVCYISGTTNDGAIFSGMKLIKKYTCNLRKHGKGQMVSFYGMAIPA